LGLAALQVLLVRLQQKSNREEGRVAGVSAEEMGLIVSNAE
jgi:hypothetical protein